MLKGFGVGRGCGRLGLKGRRDGMGKERGLKGQHKDHKMQNFPCNLTNIFL